MPNQITNLTNLADQETQLQLTDGTVASIELIFQGASERWIMNVTYGNFTANGIGACCFPNVLRQWKNVIPFGIAFTSDNQTDPFDINDFATGRVSVFLLNQEDVATVETSLFGEAN